MFFSQKWYKQQKTRQGCTTQKSGLGMHQNLHFQVKPIKHGKNQQIMIRSTIPISESGSTRDRKQVISLILVLCSLSGQPELPVVWSRMQVLLIILRVDSKLGSFRRQIIEQTTIMLFHKSCITNNNKKTARMHHTEYHSRDAPKPSCSVKTNHK